MVKLRTPRLLRAVPSLLVLVLLGGCSGYRQTLEVCFQRTSSGRFAEALAILEKSPLAENKRNRLLYLMEKGTLLRLQGEYPESNEVFEEADLLVEELFTRSLSAEGFSFLTSDNVIPYAGEDYESAYLNYLKALNYLDRGDLEEALVESRRVDEKLNYYSDSYGGKNVYREDAFLRLLTGLIYEAEGDSNNAFIAYRKSLESYRAYREKYGVAAPELLWGRLLTAARRTGFTKEYEFYLQEARDAGVEPELGGPVVAIVVNVDFIPAKHEVAAFFPTDQGFPVKLALPEFRDRPRSGISPELLVDGRRAVLEQTQNLSAVARQSLEDKKGRILAKMIARAVAKQLAADTAERELGALAGFTAKMAALLTEQADLRSWTTLPGEVRLAVVPLAPGAHTVNLNYRDCRESRTVEVANQDLVFTTFRVY